MMKRVHAYLFVITMVLLACGNSHKQPTNNQEETTTNNKIAEKEKLQTLTLEFNNKYPIKTVPIETIANVSYVPLETTESSIIQSINRVAISDKEIVICDYAQKKVFFFNHKGNFISSFKCQGNGPEEYSTIYNCCVDFKQNEIYICDYPLKYRIMVYSFDGKFLRELKFSQQIWPSIIYNYDEDYLIAYDTYNLDTNEPSNNRPYLLINKKRGTVSPLPLEIHDRISNSYMVIEGNKYQFSAINIEPMINVEDGVIISDFALDTVYKYKDHKLHPIAIRKDLEKSDLSTVCAYGNNYYIFEFIRKGIDRNTQNVTVTDSRTYLYDKEESKIYEVQLILSDITGKQGISWNSYGKALNENGFAHIFSTDLLFPLSKKNRLKGELKEIASKLKMDDNPVLMLAKFKE